MNSVQRELNVMLQDKKRLESSLQELDNIGKLHLFNSIVKLLLWYPIIYYNDNLFNKVLLAELTNSCDLQPPNLPDRVTNQPDQYYQPTNQPTGELGPGDAVQQLKRKAFEQLQKLKSVNNHSDQLRLIVKAK